MTAPYLPSPPFPSFNPAFFPNNFHRAGGNGSRRSRFANIHATDSVYVAISATTETDRKALNAVVEPMLMQASRDTTTKETNTARKGMFQPCST